MAGWLCSTCISLSFGGGFPSWECTEPGGPVKGGGGYASDMAVFRWDFNPSASLLPDQLFLSSGLSRGCRLPPSQCNTQQSLFLPSISCLCLQRSSSPWYGFRVHDFSLGEHTHWSDPFPVQGWLMLGGCAGLIVTCVCVCERLIPEHCNHLQNHGFIPATVPCFFNLVPL